MTLFLVVMVVKGLGEFLQIVHPISAEQQRKEQEITCHERFVVLDQADRYPMHLWEIDPPGGCSCLEW